MTNSDGELSEGVMAALEGQSNAGGSLGYSAEGASSGHGRSEASSDELHRSPGLRGRPLGPVTEGSREGSRGSGTGPPLKVEGYQPTRGTRPSGARSREASAHSPMGRPPLPTGVPSLPGTTRQSPARDPILEALSSELETAVVQTPDAANHGTATGPNGTVGGTMGGSVSGEPMESESDRSGVSWQMIGGQWVASPPSTTVLSDIGGGALGGAPAATEPYGIAGSGMRSTGSGPAGVGASSAAAGASGPYGTAGIPAGGHAPTPGGPPTAIVPIGDVDRQLALLMAAATPTAVYESKSISDARQVVGGHTQVNQTDTSVHQQHVSGISELELQIPCRLMRPILPEGL